MKFVCKEVIDARRRGVTLMETIFAIGVIMTGLLGLAALLPVAANNAQATLEMDRSISESTSAAAQGVAQQFNDLDRLVIMDKIAPGGALLNALPFRYVPTQNLQTIQRKIDGSIPPGTPPPNYTTFKLETPGYGHHDFDAGLKSALCIDPLGFPSLEHIDAGTSTGAFVTSPTSVPQFTNPAAADTAYDYSRFPFYSEHYGVLGAPNASIGSGSAVTWPMSPRMWRCTLRSSMYESINYVRPWQIISAGRARHIFRGTGGLASVDPGKDGDGRGVLMNRSLIGNRFVDAATDSASEYTWFATLTPPFIGENPYKQSIVVVRQRSPHVPLRQDDPLALQKDNYVIDDADENPAGERLLWVGDSIGFQGGAGGDVLLYGSQAISDDIQTGEWVMLSRQPHLTVETSTGVFEVGTAPTPTGVAIHRWYRILRVEEADEDAETIDGFVWPGGTSDVWRRWVTLAGPDWAFQDETPTNTSPIDDTFCTVVTGAVSVISSEVVLQ